VVQAINPKEYLKKPNATIKSIVTCDCQINYFVKGENLLSMD